MNDKRVLLWGTGTIIGKIHLFVKLFAESKGLELVGITSNSHFDNYLGIPFVEKKNISKLGIDYVFACVGREYYLEVEDEAERIGGVDRNRVIPYSVLFLQEFDFDKYSQLKKSPPTIFSMNCWGGLTYHTLCLPMCSPLINMFESFEDFVKLMKDPERYLTEPLVHISDRYKDSEKHMYPVCRCGDVVLNFEHYRSFGEACEIWERRKKRVNLDNAFIECYVEKQSDIALFEEIPFKKKVCFIPFDYDNDDCFFVDIKNLRRSEGELFKDVLFDIARGERHYYDSISLLLYNQRIRLWN